MANKYTRINVAGTGGGADPAFVQSFLIANWAGPSGGEYTYTISAASHGKGANPAVTVYEDVGVTWDEVSIEIEIDVSGNVVLKVTEVADTRFDGKVVIN